MIAVHGPNLGQVFVTFNPVQNTKITTDPPTQKLDPWIVMD
jgi:hypothetical protein